MEIADLVRPDHVVLGLPAQNKAHLLNELARRAAAATGRPQKQIAEAIAARERLGSTGVGAGIAMPHAQLSGLDRFYALIARLARAIDYDAIDGQPVDLVALLLIPQGTKEHLQALAAISRRLRNPAVAAMLRRATTAPALQQAIIGG